MLSPSALNALKLAAVWIGIAGAGVLGFVNADLVRDMLGLRLEFSDDDAPSRPASDAPAAADDDKPTEETPTSRASLGRTVQLKAGAHGHFHSRIHVNGRAVQAMVDTGASIVALTFEDARNAGIHVRDGDYTHRVSTANGVARVALVTLDSVAIEDIVVRDVRAAVAEPGKLTTTLLGMSFLGQLRRTQMSRGVLVLEE
ncbi:TIGR02281 family clan AA aspartic protease [Hyphomicrobium sp. CS1BSMeth3]|uniref:retropepsin-like aspartic protease family protein n=1 Tax=Hyphomicrobium sp. CS1BSMeth3 TaxID=1892844 RepID=UPI000931A0EA|nr:TIGR02281 family clan AA aspartic protease [Hyphomicrobium sp. CS1BSMeth3]